MSCPKGYHQHYGSTEGADGAPKMLQCHPISEKHANEKTLMYHQMALNEGKGQDIETKEPFIPEESKRKIKMNNAKIKDYLERLKKNKVWGPLLVPVMCGLWACNGSLKNAQKLKQRAKTKNQKKLADVYSKTVGEIVNSVQDVDFSKLPEKPKPPKEPTKESMDKYKKELEEWKNTQLIPAMKSLLQEQEDYKTAMEKKMNDAKEKALTEGKSSDSYAVYRAYADYLNLVKEKTDMLTAKIAVLENTREIEGRRKSPTTTDE